jgi:L-amino acid N-acyltransferase YncA
VTTPDAVMVRVAVEPLTPEHAAGVLDVYAEGIATGQATFETDVPSWEDWDRARLPGHRFVAVDGDRVLGWVAVSPVSPRAAYAGVVEHSVYVAAAARGRGVGAALMTRLVESCDGGGVWTIQSGVFPENVASLALHARFEFRRVGVRERIGRRDGRWRDIVLLERRSTVVGV